MCMGGSKQQFDVIRLIAFLVDEVDFAATDVADALPVTVGQIKRWAVPGKDSRKA